MLCGAAIENSMRLRLTAVQSVLLAFSLPLNSFKQQIDSEDAGVARSEAELTLKCSPICSARASHCIVLCAT